MRPSSLVILVALIGARITAATAQTAPPEAPPTSGPLDAAAIYDRTRATIAARKLPPYIAYDEYAAFDRRGRLKVVRSHIILRMSDGKVSIDPIPDSPRDHVDRPSVRDRPLVFPTTSFGLVKRHGEPPSMFEAGSTPAPPPDTGAVKVIGRVRSVAREYDPTLIGTETVAGAPVYHLKLVPRYDPEHHPLRDIYVDTTTFDMRRALIEIYAGAGPARSRPTVTVDFAPVDGVWLISHASMDFVLRFAFLSYGGSAEYRTSAISFPAEEPDWLFDPAGLAEHYHPTPAPTAAP